MHPHNAMHPLKLKWVHCIKIRVISQNAQSASGFYRLQAFSFSPLWKDFSVSSLRDLNLGYVVGVSLVKRYAAEAMK